jgi:hypothetical protein
MRLPQFTAVLNWGVEARSRIEQADMSLFRDLIK